jgi:hypothetical protein
LMNAANIYCRLFVWLASGIVGWQSLWQSACV